MNAKGQKEKGQQLVDKPQYRKIQFNNIHLAENRGELERSGTVISSYPIGENRRATVTTPNKQTKDQPSMYLQLQTSDDGTENVAICHLKKKNILFLHRQESSHNQLVDYSSSKGR